MKNKMTISEFKNYIISEATKLYKVEILKEEKKKIEEQLSIINECQSPEEIKTLRKIAEEMRKRASGWSVKEAIEMLSEIDKNAMNAAKKDIESDGGKFEPLGKNKFEKNINKKELKKAMSPENVEESEEKEVPENTSDYKEQPGYIHEEK